MNQYLIAKINEYINKHHIYQHSLKYSEVVEQYDVIVEPYYIPYTTDNQIIRDIIFFDDFNYEFHLDGHLDGITSYDDRIDMTVSFRWGDPKYGENLQFSGKKPHHKYNYRSISGPRFSIQIPVYNKIVRENTYGQRTVVGDIPKNYWYTYPDKESLLKVLN